MQDTEGGFVNIDRLSEKLFEIYKFGYSDNEFSRFDSDFDKFVIKRLGFLILQARVVVIEESYVETEWKDMISLHYINTTYSATLLPRVIRVHFLSNPKIEQEEYLGFITLRPIEEIQLVLSYVFVNWDVFPKYEGARYQFVGYKKSVHCNGQELSIRTYPLLTQDSIVTCCADVNIITLSRFWAHEYKGKKLEIHDICKDECTAVYPREITMNRFVDLCTVNHIPLKAREIFLCDLVRDHTSISSDSDFGVGSIKSSKGLLRYIDAYLDSNLPVVVFVDYHVVQIVGYVDSGDEKQYFVFDDSGVLDLKYINCSDESSKGRFCYQLNLMATLFSPKTFGTPDNGFTSDVHNESARDAQHMDLISNYVTLAIPQSERVYIDYPFYETLLGNMLRHLWAPGSEQFQWFFDHKNNILPEVKVRSRLIECNDFIKFLKDNLNYACEFQGSGENNERTINVDKVVANLNNAVTTLQRISLPHYLWYTELVDGEGRIVGLCADPTRFYDNTTHLDKVFYNARFDDDKRGISVIKSMWADERV